MTKERIAVLRNSIIKKFIYTTEVFVNCTYGIQLGGTYIINIQFVSFRLKYKQ
jgi:hypothetical protein